MNVKVLLSIALSLALICSGTSAWAKVSGTCADCHTMHNSQDGAAVEASPNRSLTKGDCVGCHTGTNASGGNIPYVTDTTAPTYSADGTGATTLAGGSFYWVGTDDSTAHNVVGIKTADANMPNNTPPGWDPAVSGNVIAGGTATWGSQLTCAGTYGCHGPHTAADDFEDIAGAHHGDDSAIDGTSTASSYRFLNGIVGIEDSDWEFQPTASAHNGYKGAARTAISAIGSEANTDTISYFCATCHGQYHSGTGVVNGGTVSIGTNPWLRHPSDYDMADTEAGAEYHFYNGTSTPASATYSTEAPVALSTPAVSSTVDVSTTGEAIVTCISCHRAHGSKYSDLLRWDYNSASDSMIAGGGANNTGCFICHTTKDD